MKYICHKRFKGTTLNGYANIPYGTEYESNGSFLCDNGNPIFATTSLNCHKHFARNDDGQGLRRGALTYAIAYAPRGKEPRFSENEVDLLTREYMRFLKTTDTILFNDAFFNADISELETMAKALNIKIKG